MSSKVVIQFNGTEVHVKLSSPTKEAKVVIDGAEFVIKPTKPVIEPAQVKPKIETVQAIKRTKSQLRKQIQIEEFIQQTGEWLKREEEKDRIEREPKKFEKIKNVDPGEDEIVDIEIDYCVPEPKDYKSPFEDMFKKIQRINNIDEKN